jgi:protein arginine N-methyltransferase 7
MAEADRNDPTAEPVPMLELARRAMDKLAAAAANDPRKLSAVALMAASVGREEKAYSLAVEARELAPDDPRVRAATQGAISAGVPRWHFTIVLDEPRNRAWRAAIEKAVTPDSVVLDVGAGSGLLAMMAARAGAKRVVSCEMNPAVAEAAVRVVAANGFSDRVAIVSRHSGELDAERDMGGKADVFVSEILSNDMVGEDAVPTVRDVVQRLLKPGGKVIPASARVRVALAYWERDPRLQLSDVDGFDLGALSELAAVPRQVKSTDSRLHLRSAPADLFDFDFAGVRFPDPQARLALRSSGGTINGIVQWIEICLDEEIRYDNHPGSTEASCWACLLYPLDADIAPAPGATVVVRGEYTSSELRLWHELHEVAE